MERDNWFRLDVKPVLEVAKIVGDTSTETDRNLAGQKYKLPMNNQYYRKCNSL
jgi:hypothetical protein